MADASCRILCTGDLHLGRYPSRTQSRDRAWAVDSVWADTVSYAVEQAVDVVALTGDVVDDQNKRYEALGPLQRGLRRLEEAGIPAVAVAGNHDFDALPRLAEMVEAEHFHLLGRCGEWSTVTVAPEGRSPVQFVVWSFREAHEQDAPVESFPDGRLRDDAPTVGLLHADLNAPGSVYAPVSLGALRQCPVSAWLLGHIHAPSLRDDRSPLVLYPGSLQPLDPSEPGPHGPWRVEVVPDGTSTAVQLPRAPLRYEHLEVDVDAIDDEGAVEAAVTDAMRDRLRTAREEGSRVQYQKDGVPASPPSMPPPGHRGRYHMSLRDLLAATEDSERALVDAILQEARSLHRDLERKERSLRRLRRDEVEAVLRRICDRAPTLEDGSPTETKDGST
ncbi:DNA repair exonuclease SbcCD nuclease subunit [Salinibacter ruber]|uniref:metallophosphoesterase family protein n=1 Tax=Salinibacter ruber TaxID=146919 RepID=UPI002168B979|nr:DNA repair exonuclease SbcCD nuclease subunit [Salinibacter ruber]MCS3713267.1 DNA repair exonuclease SbcCD nuclease subunit [Salinibacter ruber]